MPIEQLLLLRSETVGAPNPPLLKRRGIRALLARYPREFIGPSENRFVCPQRSVRVKPRPHRPRILDNNRTLATCRPE
jgi:hypothetical protein